MSENEKNNSMSSDELNRMLDEYIASLEERARIVPQEENEKDVSTVTDVAAPAEPDPEPAPEEEPESESVTLHFTDVSSLDVIGNTQELNIDNHLSDEPPSELMEFNAAPDSEESNEENDDSETDEKQTDFKNNGTDDDDEDHKPWYKVLFGKIGSFIWNSGFLIKAVVYVAVVLIISAFLSYYVISVGNDVFAFVKTNKEVTLNIPEGITRKELAFLLEKNDIIEYQWAFDLYLRYKDCNEEAFLSGEHTFDTHMNYSQIISELTEVKRELVQVSITIPEGYTVDQIIDLFVSNGIGTRENFVEAINEYPYQHEFVKELEKIGYSKDRRYRLEGYLYPDTYYFYKDSAEYLVINKLLNNFNNKFWIYYESVFKEDIEKAGLTFDDIVTLASMIQSEAKLEIDFEFISYVFRNRLAHPQSFPKLESDATVQYAIMARGGDRTEDLTAEQLMIDDPYNTRLYEGLPPGAICNPGFDALSAAIYPDMPLLDSEETINAFFFVSNKAGKTYYAETLSGHNENVKQVAKDNAAYDKD